MFLAVGYYAEQAYKPGPAQNKSVDRKKHVNHCTKTTTHEVPHAKNMISQIANFQHNEIKTSSYSTCDWDPANDLHCVR